jgi:Uma2 family endonuclease
VIVFLPGKQPIEMRSDDRLPVPEFIELELTVAQVFGWLKAGKLGG